MGETSAISLLIRTRVPSPGWRRRDVRWIEWLLLRFPGRTRGLVSCVIDMNISCCAYAYGWIGRIDHHGGPVALASILHTTGDPIFGHLYVA